MNRQNFFQDCLTRAGIYLCNDQGRLSVSCSDQNESGSEIKSFLSMNSSRVDDFLNSMEGFVEERSNLEVLLEPLNVISDIEQRSSCLNQSNSVIKLLLRVERVQKFIFEILVRRILSLTSAFVASDSLQLELKILNTIRWCDYIYDPPNLLNYLLESIQVY